MSATSFFGGAFFGGEYFNSAGPTPPTPVSDDQPSNWQANYWKNKSRADRENEEMLERISLGILPPELHPDAKAAAQRAVEAAMLASAEMARASDDAAQREALLKSMEARTAYERAYQLAMGEAYIAEAVAEQWLLDMKRLARRRRATLLLLH